MPIRNEIAVGLTLLCLLISFSIYAQQPKGNDVNTPLHTLRPDYKTPYQVINPEDVKGVLDRVLKYLDTATPAALIRNNSKVEIPDLSRPVEDAILKPGDFRLTSYEWGVTYSGMLQIAAATGDRRYSDYVSTRFKFLGEVVPYFQSFGKQYPGVANPLRNIFDPKPLDDAGSMCAAMIKATRAGLTSLRPQIDNYIQYIMTKEYRLSDGTFARNRPLPNTLWLYDLYMSVPALAQMGRLTGDNKYYDEAVKQIKQFSSRMFNREKGMFMHGWVESMDVHPQFHWARANGWALMTLVDVLDVLPAQHPDRTYVLELLKAHIHGLSRYQSGDGFWHQLLDRNDSYLETSATAIYTYCIAHAINNGWINREAHAPMALLAWHAVSTKVSESGQVEGTCVGTGMAFDPAFYYYRPTHNYAAHGYGPVLLAGAEMYELLKSHPPEINDSALMFPD